MPRPGARMILQMAGLRGVTKISIHPLLATFYNNTNSTCSRMPKRKRTLPPAGSLSPESASSRALGQRKFKCAQRIDAAQKPLVAALRHAAGLERQKHSRRKKTAQASNDTKALARLEAEYAHLKSLDLGKVAGMHLRKTIGRVKTLTESGCMPDNIGEVEKGGVQDSTLLNVKGRLFKVDAVRKVVDETIDDLREIIGSGSRAGKQEDIDKEIKSKKAKIQVEEKDAPAQDVEEDDLAFSALDALIAAPSSAEEDSEASLSDGHRPPSEVDNESEDEDEDEDEDSLSDSAQSASTANALDFHNFSGDEDSDEASGSDSKQEDSISDPESTPLPLAKVKRRGAETDLTPTTGSHFLPALSHPTYISGSESDASDIEAEVAPRKNRRGQKARQKIWEQKYKDQAKHIVKQERDKGWDAKRGAVSDRGGRGGRGGRSANVGRGPEKSGANEMPLGPKKKKRDDAGTLHPSWQAAKAAKEKKMEIKPMGKKVVFD